MTNKTLLEETLDKEKKVKIKLNEKPQTKENSKNFS
jgi:hypothetical protein